ncbi:Response regulator receiver protein [Gammaproteobacteria bacterium]
MIEEICVARILVIEDDPQFRAMLEQMLGQDGHQFSVAVNGVEGLERYYQQRPALIITDILMPKKDGIDVIVEIKRGNPEARIIAISGVRRSITSEFTLESATLMGVNAVLTKPFARADLQKAIQNCPHLTGCVH